MRTHIRYQTGNHTIYYRITGRVIDIVCRINSYYLCNKFSNITVIDILGNRIRKYNIVNHNFQIVMHGGFQCVS